LASSERNNTLKTQDLYWFCEKENAAMTYDLSLNATTAQAQAEESFVLRMLENWQARRAVRHLLKLDDHVLHDTGTSRSDVEWAAHLPLTVNASLALDERMRRSGQR
jgi:uncharacterized protein YjiS (DUF1127 family)